MESLPEWFHWYEWGVHTNFSFLLGASHPHEYIEKASDFSYQGVGVCDFDGVYGLARSYRAVKDLSLNMFYGAEIHLAPDHDKPVLLRDTIVIYALNHKGYYDLCRILSYVHRDGKHNGFITLDVLSSYLSSNLVIFQPMRGMIRSENWQQQERFQMLRDLTGGRFYFWISRHFHRSEDIWAHRVLELTKNLKIPYVFSQDVFMSEPSHKVMTDLLHAIRTNQSLDHASEEFFVNSERSLKNKRDLYSSYRVFPGFKQSIELSHDISCEFNFSFSELRYRYPKDMIPDAKSSQDFLEELVWEGLRDIYGENIPKKVLDLVGHEISLVKLLDFSDYFLTVWDIVRWAREQKILCQGRGSAANSVICYALKITALDPCNFDLLFERFISVERGDPPDIDVDFEHERREEVINYIYEKFGRDRAAMVANVITFRKRGALRAVGEALGMPKILIDDASAALRSKVYRGADAGEVVEYVSRNGTITDEDHKETSLHIGFERVELPDHIRDMWSKLSSRLCGFPKHLGIHSGGFVLSNEHLNYLCPVEPATMPGRTVIQWSKDDIEALGFFKIDVLCLGMLTAIRKCFSYVKQFHGADLDLQAIPADDKKTYEMIQRADTVGTFQIESRAQMSMLPRLKPEKFYDLVVQVGIIRPGPIQGGMIHPYLKRRKGQERVEYAHPKIKSILERTLGVPIFQEQIMRVAMAVGDFTPGEANELRKSMGAWKMNGDLSKWSEKMASGMRNHGISEAFIQTTLSQFVGFSEYGFPESHAASFALIAYASSYLKAHYPACFYTSILNSQPMGFYNTHALVGAARRNGVLTLPVCVQSSCWDHQIEQRGGEYFIRLGFRVVSGVRRVSMKNFENRRQRKGGFSSLKDLLSDDSLMRSDLTALAAADAFKIFGLKRRDALWLAEACPHQGVFMDHESVSFSPETHYERMEQDFRSFSTTLYDHPCLIVKKHYWSYPLSTKRMLLSADLKKKLSGDQVVVFGMVLVVQSPSTAKGMVFMTLEDEKGFINLAFAPDVYKKYHEQVHGKGFLCVLGKLQSENEGHSVLVREVVSPDYSDQELIEINQSKKSIQNHLPQKTLQSIRMFH